MVKTKPTDKALVVEPTTGGTSPAGEIAAGSPVGYVSSGYV